MIQKYSINFQFFHYFDEHMSVFDEREKNR